MHGQPNIKIQFKTWIHESSLYNFQECLLSCTDFSYNMLLQYFLLLAHITLRYKQSVCTVKHLNFK